MEQSYRNLEEKPLKSVYDLCHDSVFRLTGATQLSKSFLPIFANDTYWYIHVNKEGLITRMADSRSTLSYNKNITNENFIAMYGAFTIDRGDYANQSVLGIYEKDPITDEKV